MSGSKRARPDGYAEGAGSREPSAKVLKEDTGAIYEATLNKLKLGAARAVAPSTTGGNLRANASSWLQVGKQQEQHAGGNGSHSNGAVAHRQTQQGLVLRVASDSPNLMNGGVPVITTQRGCGLRLCYVCVAGESSNICFHCSRGCCERCSRRCEGCQELFCSICSTSNYNERYDRSFCFDCNTKHRTAIV